MKLLEKDDAITIMSTFSLSFSSRTRSNGLLSGGNETKLAMKATSIS